MRLQWVSKLRCGVCVCVYIQVYIYIYIHIYIYTDLGKSYDTCTIASICKGTTSNKTEEGVVFDSSLDSSQAVRFRLGIGSGAVLTSQHCCSALQCAAVCCSVLQCVIVCVWHLFKAARSKNSKEAPV